MFIEILANPYSVKISRSQLMEKDSSMSITHAERAVTTAAAAAVAARAIAAMRRRAILAAAAVGRVSSSHRLRGGRREADW